MMMLKLCKFQLVVNVVITDNFCLFIVSFSSFQPYQTMAKRQKLKKRKRPHASSHRIKTFLDDFKRFKYELTYSATEQDLWIQGA